MITNDTQLIKLTTQTQLTTSKKLQRYFRVLNVAHDKLAEEEKQIRRKAVNQ